MTDLAYLLYSGLAFAEVFVLFASVIAVLVLAVRQVVKAIASMVDVAIGAGSSDTEHHGKILDPLGAVAGGRVRKIPGAHNDRF
jgi:hypothetical protein